jgi:hypothetical protein
VSVLPNARFASEMREWESSNNIHEASSHDATDWLTKTSLTRRRFLGVSVAVAAGPSFGFAPSKLSVDNSGGCVKLSCSDAPPWVVDPSNFDGRPIASCVRAKDVYCIQLRDAFFPGTQVRADFDLKVEAGTQTLEAVLNLPGLGFRSRFSLRDWLEGKAVATSSSSKHVELYQSAGTHLEIATGAKLSMLPDWTFSYFGVRHLDFEIEGEPVAIRALKFSLAGDVPSAFSQPAPRRLMLALALHPKSDFPLLFAHGMGVRIDEPAKFVHGEIQVSSGRQALALAVEPRDPAGRVLVSLETEASTSDLEWSVNRAGTVVTYFGADKAISLTGHFDQQTMWIENALSAAEIALADADGAAATLIAAAGKITGTGPRPVVRRIAISMPGVDKAVLVPRDGKADAEVEQPMFILGRSIELDGYDLDILRAHDMGVWKLRFRNVDLIGGWGGWSLRKGDRGDRALIEIELPPQGTLEEGRYWSEFAPPGCKPSEICTDPQSLPQSHTPLFKDDPKDVERYKAVCTPRENPTWAGPKLIYTEPSHFTCEIDGGDIPLELEALLRFDPSRDELDRLKRGGSGWLKLKRPERAVEKAEPGSFSSWKEPVSLAVQNTPQTEAATRLVGPYNLVLGTLPGASWRPTQIRSFGFGSDQRVWSMKATGDVRMRAVWSPDLEPSDAFVPTKKKQPFSESRTSTEPEDRNEIVWLSAGFGMKARLGSGNVHPVDGDNLNGIYEPQAWTADRFMMSAYGASLRWDARWKPPGSPLADKRADNGKAEPKGALSLQRWNPAMYQGRDSKVIVEYKGFLLPLGIPAVLVKETERLFKQEAIVDKGDLVKRGGRQNTQRIVAMLVQRQYIRIDKIEPKLFPTLNQPDQSRKWPHKSIIMKTRQTPDLRDPSETQIIASKKHRMFWPMVTAGAQDCNMRWYDFPFEFTDGSTTYHAPLIFVDNNAAHLPDRMQEALKYWAALDQDYLKKRIPPSISGNITEIPKGFAVASGAPIAYCQPKKSGDGEYQTNWIRLSAEAPKETKQAHLKLPKSADTPKDQVRYIMSPQMEAADQPPFYPGIGYASAVLSQIAGASGNPGKSSLVAFDDIYLRSEFDRKENAGEIFLKFVDEGLKMDFSGDSSRSGGPFAPTVLNSYISRVNGPVGGGDSEVVFGPKSEVRPVRAIRAQNEVDAGTSPPDIRNGQFNPQEFFRKTLGDAKLFQTLSLADIASTAVLLSGTNVPKLLQTYEWEIRDRIQKVVVEVSSAIQSMEKKLAEAVNHLPGPIQDRLKERIRAIDEARLVLEAAARSSNPAGLVKAAGGIKQAFEDLLAEMGAIANNPVSLLPKEVQDVIDAFNRALAVVKNPGELQKSLLEPLRAVLEDTLNSMMTMLADELKIVVLGELGKSEFRKINYDPAHLNALLKAGDVTQIMPTLDQIGQVPGCRPLALGLQELVLAYGQSFGQAKEAERRIHEQLSQALGMVRAVDKGIRGLHGALKTIEQETVKEAEKQFRAALKSIVQDLLWRWVVQTKKGEVEKEFSEYLSDQIRETASAMHSAQAALQAELTNTTLPKETQQQLASALDSAQKTRIEISHAMDAFQSSVSELRKLIDNGLYKEPTPEKLWGLIQGPIVEMLARGCMWVLAQEEVRTRFTQLKETYPYYEEKLKAYNDSLDSAAVAAKAKYRACIVLLGIGLPAPLDKLKDAAIKAAQGTETDVEDWRDLNHQLSLASQWIQLLNQGVSAKLRDLLVKESDQFADKLVKELLRGGGDAMLARVEKIATGLGEFLKKAEGWLAKGYVRQDLIGRLEDVVGELNAFVKALTGLQGVTGGVLTGGTLATQWSSALDAGDKAARLLAELVREIESAFQSGDIARIIDVRVAVDAAAKKALEAIGLPARVELSYGWECPVKPFPESNPMFKPREDRGNLEQGVVLKTLKIDASYKTDLLGKQPATYQVDGFLSPFDIILFPGSKFLTLRFDAMRFKSGSGRATTLDVRLNEVVLSDSLNFVKKLQDYLGLNDGVFIEPLLVGPGVRVGYRFNKDIVPIGAMQFENVAFLIAVSLPFESKPARVEMGVSSEETPFLVSAPPYIGGGYIGLRGRLTRIEVITAGMEFGIGRAFSFGVLQGSGRVVVGMNIMLAGSRAALTGYFRATGRADIASIFSMGANLLISTSYDGKTGMVSGRGTFSVSFSIGFLDYSFGFEVSDDQPGSGGPEDHEDESSNSLVSLLATGRGGAPVGTATKVLPPLPEDVAKYEARLRELKADKMFYDVDSWEQYWSAFAEVEHG